MAVADPLILSQAVGSEAQRAVGRAEPDAGCQRSDDPPLHGSRKSTKPRVHYGLRRDRVRVEGEARTGEHLETQSKVQVSDFKTALHSHFQL